MSRKRVRALDCDDEGSSLLPRWQWARADDYDRRGESRRHNLNAYIMAADPNKGPFHIHTAAPLRGRLPASEMALR